MVQWLGYCASNAGDLSSIPGQGTRSHMPHATSQTQHGQIIKKRMHLMMRVKDIKIIGAEYIFSKSLEGKLIESK